MLGLGLGIGLMQNVAAQSGGGGGGTIWNGSTDTPASSADWVRSGSNLIGTRSSGTGDALLRASTGKTGSSLQFYKNNVAQASAIDVSGLSGTLYPAASTGGTGTQIT